MPFSALPKPVPSSASPSGIISAPGWAAPIAAPSPTSRNSSARRSRAVNRPDFCPYYRFSELMGEAGCNQEYAGGLKQGLDNEAEPVIAQREASVLQDPGIAALDRPAVLSQS